MTALSTDLRSRLENAVKEARAVAERGARQALDALAVDRREPHGSMAPEDRSLRNRLRAHGRQLGDTLNPNGTQTIDRLVREVAYEHWHRMLFARFLAENDLLLEPASGVAITMEECRDLARERNEDPWGLAASFAEGMLPRIFRIEDPALQVTLPPETRQALQRLLDDLPKPVFTEDDSLGWTYQFWQSAEKEAVNARVKSGEKITGETLPAVTQLFTEPYMVRFLLHNTLGAWHAGRVLPEALREGAGSEQQLRDAVRLSPEGGYDFDYLRFAREAEEDDQFGEPAGRWRPAAGTFERWPRESRELRVLDPCCGSGHFLVEAFHVLVRLRMEEEGLDAVAATRAVIAENLFGLELDARCTQIAAFNLALAAWKLVGTPIELPAMRIACSGIGPNTSKKEWLTLAAEAAAAGGMPGKRDLFGSEDTLLTAGVRGGLEALYDLFEMAPDLGSLIDPSAIGGKGPQLDVLEADFTALGPLFDAMLGGEEASAEETERAVAAKGMAEAASILAGPKEGYTLVITNVPYLGRGDHSSWFKSWIDTNFTDAKANLATVFLRRCLAWVARIEDSGTVATVNPQNWLFLTTYERFRRRMLRKSAWEMIAQLGPGAFEGISGEVVDVALLILTGSSPLADHLIAEIDLPQSTTPQQKMRELIETKIEFVSQAGVQSAPGATYGLVLNGATPSGELFTAHAGLQTGDKPRFARCFWERTEVKEGWSLFQGTVAESKEYGGRESIVLWEGGNGAMTSSPACYVRGKKAWTKQGVIVSQIGKLPVTLYSGTLYDNSTLCLIPANPNNILPIWEFARSGALLAAVREYHSKMSVDPKYLERVSLDLSYWKEVAAEKYPDGLPEPYSDDPTQWIFHGHPAHAEAGTELQVAVARLLGYRWPAELDPEMRLSEEARALVERSQEVDAQGLADEDGIVCLSSVRGEPSSADRLRSLLAAFGSDWTAAKVRELLTSSAGADRGTGKRADTLDEWLRENFFEEHCKLFHQRPFIWHIWDGLKEGFNALVNYHRLAGSAGQGRRTLESLTFTYLGDWIERQRADREAGKEGADARLAAALKLQEELQKILEGEPPYDLFIRWKPLHEQPIGWDPDINDGVVLNIRPFVRAEDVRYKGAGVLRRKPNIKWTKDRGKAPESLRPREQFTWFWGCDPKNNPRHRTDFGADTPNAVPAGEKFDGVRWNALHYTRAAREVAREGTRAEVDA